jgi:hypothetical protein
VTWNEHSISLVNIDGELSVMVDGVVIPDAFPLLGGDGGGLGGVVRLGDETVLIITSEETPRSPLAEFLSAVSSTFGAGTPTQAVTVDRIWSNSLPPTGSLQYSGGIAKASPSGSAIGTQHELFEGEGGGRWASDMVLVVSSVLIFLFFGNSVTGRSLYTHWCLNSACGIHRPANILIFEYSMPVFLKLAAIVLNLLSCVTRQEPASDRKHSFLQ